jgi:phage tail-like protein
MSTALTGPERAARTAVDRGALVVTLDGTVVQTVPLGGRAVTVGRLPGNDVVLPHPAVSRQHAEVRAEAAGVLVVDVGSTGGTFVDGVRLLRDQPAALDAGAAARVGPYELTYAPPRPEPVVLRPPSGAVFEAAPAAAPAATPAGGDGRGGAAADDEAPPAPPGRPTYPAPLPEGPESRYLRDLPAIFHGAEAAGAGDGGAGPNDFLGRMLLIFEALWEPLEQRQDHIALYYDPRTAPAAMLPWLASWLDLALDPRWPEERRRRLLREAMELYRWRGTPYGLARVLEVAAGVSARVTDDPAEPWVVRVAVTLPPGGAARRDEVEALVRAHKPAHVGYVLEFLP